MTSRDELILSAVPLARDFARRHRVFRVEAEDVAGELCLLAVVKAAAVGREPKVTWEAFLTGCFHNRLKKFAESLGAKKRAGRPWSLEAACRVRDRRPTPEEVAILREDVEAVRAMLAQLPPTSTEVVRMHYGLDGWGGMTLGEVARKLGRKRDGVNSIHGRTIKRLRRELERRERMGRRMA